MTNSSAAAPRVLVVEDEYLIRMLLEDMLDELGYRVAAAVGTISEAASIATSGEFNAAILDVNLDGQEIYPVADILAKRGLPFVFVTGYGERSLPDLIAAALPSRNHSRPSNSSACSPSYCLAEHFSQFSHKRLVGEVESQRRHRDAFLGQRREVASWRRADDSPAPKRNPEIRIAAPIVARVDA